VPYDDTEALAQAMLAVLESPALRARLVAGGAQALAERFAPERLVMQVIAVYQQVAGSLSGMYQTADI
jgi:glycosyltransferase involved in cell wall biosynthesis